MGEELAKEPSFEDVIIQKLRKDIGELMPEEALKKIVNIAIERMFFERKQKSTYSSEQNPSWLEAEVSALMKVSISEQVRIYLKEHPEEVEKAIKQAIGKGVTDMLANAINGIMHQAFAPMQQQLHKALTGQQY